MMPIWPVSLVCGEGHGTHLSRDFCLFCAFFVNDDFPVRDFGMGLSGIVLRFVCAVFTNKHYLHLGLGLGGSCCRTFQAVREVDPHDIASPAQLDALGARQISACVLHYVCVLCFVFRRLLLCLCCVVLCPSLLVLVWGSFACVCLLCDLVVWGVFCVLLSALWSLGPARPYGAAYRNLASACRASRLCPVPPPTLVRLDRRPALSSLTDASASGGAQDYGGLVHAPSLPPPVPSHPRPRPSPLGPGPGRRRSTTPLHPPRVKAQRLEARPAPPSRQHVAYIAGASLPPLTDASCTVRSALGS